MLCRVFLHGEGLKRALVLGAYLSLFSFPGILTAPTIPMSEVPTKTLHELQLEDLNHVVNAVGNAQNNAKIFMDKFVGTTSGRNFVEVVQGFPEEGFPWLPRLPKKLGDPVPEEHLKELEYPEAFLDVYDHLQRFRVAVQQCVDDEEERDGPFLSNYNETLQFLRLLLLEVQTAIDTNSLTVPGNLTKDIMGSVRHTDNSSIRQRNLVIYRDYLNLLEYIVDVFKYFQKIIA